MPKKPRQEVSVFIASPGDLAPERQVFKATLDALNAGFGDGAGVLFEPLGWEDLLASTGRRSQGVINREVNRCDLFLLVLHRRWGQPAPDSKASSYTEEEFKLAMARWKKSGKPEVMIFFKNVDAASLADPGPELKKVVAFRKSLEKRRDTLYRSFNTEADFGQEVDKHLRAFAKGGWDELDAGRGALAMSGSELGKARKTGRSTGKGAVAKADQSLVQAHLAEVSLARAALDAAREGRIQEATMLFAKATEGTVDLQVLGVAIDFYREVGQTENASRLVRRQAAIAKDRTIAARHVMAMQPPGWSRAVQQQMMDQLLSNFPKEAADEMRSVEEEVFGGGRLESFMLDQYVKHFSAAELMQMAQMHGSAEGQSMMRKMPQMMLESGQYGAREFQRVLKARYGDADADAIEAAAEQPRLQ